MSSFTKHTYAHPRKMLVQESNSGSFVQASDARSTAGPEPETSLSKAPLDPQLTLPAISSNGDVAIVDFCDLLGAVLGRLTTLADHGPPQSALCAGPLMVAAQLRSDVRDCARALAQLHRTIAHEMQNSSRLQFDVARAPSGQGKP